MNGLSAKTLVIVVACSVFVYLCVGYAVGNLGKKVTRDLVKHSCKIERKIQRRTGEPMSVECQDFFDKARR